MSSIMEQGSVWLIDGVYHISKGKHMYEKGVYVFENTDTGSIYGADWEAMKQYTFCHKASTADEARAYVNKLQKDKPSEDTETLVCKDIKERQKLGLNKYGTSVANNPLELIEWLGHGYEEMLDAAIYMRRAIQEIEKGKTIATLEVPEPEPELKAGDFIKITKLPISKEYRYFKVGDQAKLLYKHNGYWFADFNYNVDVVKGGKWYISTASGAEFVKIDKPEPLPEPELPPEVIDPSLFVDGEPYDLIGKGILDGTVSIYIEVISDTAEEEANEYIIALRYYLTQYTHAHRYPTYTDALTAIQNLINELNK